MIIKSSSLVYLFDFDGTLVGDNNWKNYLSNTISCFKKLHFNPSKLDIRWNILTSRPKVDFLIVYIICKLFKFNQGQIFTSKTFFYNFQNDVQSYQSKESIIKSILDGKIKIKNYVKPIEKIVFVDNDINCITYLNNNKQNYNYIAMTVYDFLNKDYIFLLS